MRLSCFLIIPTQAKLAKRRELPHQVDIRSLTSEELAVQPQVRVVNPMCPSSSDNLSKGHNSDTLAETMTSALENPLTPPHSSSTFRKMEQRPKRQ